jgi:hypothetical protein
LQFLNAGRAVQTWIAGHGDCDLSPDSSLLKKLDASTRANADVAAKAQTAVAQTAERLDEFRDSFPG